MLKTIDTENGRILSYAELSPDCVKMLTVIMAKQTELSALCDQANKQLPENCYFQLYGKGDCVIVRECKPDESEPHSFD